MVEQRRCTQINCGYYLQGGCRNCEECSAEPYNINTGCQRCLRCEGVPNELRFGDNNNDKSEDEIEPQGIIVLMGKKRKKVVEENGIASKSCRIICDG